MARIIDANDPAAYVATMTSDQLRTLAASTRPEHIAYGFAAELELVMRGEK